MKHFHHLFGGFGHHGFGGFGGFGHRGFGHHHGRGFGPGPGFDIGLGFGASPVDAFGRGRGGHRGDGRRGGGPGDAGFGGRGMRVFAQGGLKLLVLGLLERQACHGYEIIKEIEQLVGGDYSPSPGTIYPTLAYLADLGYAVAVDSEGGRKQFSITEAGRQHLAERRAELDLLLSRLDVSRSESGARRAPELMRAMGNLKTALQLRVARGTTDPELLRKVAAILDQAALDVERA